MKTVSQPKATELVKAGWVEETHFCYSKQFDGTWFLVCYPYGRPSARIELLPAPTAGEIAERVSYRDLQACFNKHMTIFEMGTKEWWIDFSEWLHSTLLDPDKMAEVWIAVHKKEAP